MMRKTLALLLCGSLQLIGCFQSSPTLAGGATETETGTAQVLGEVKWPDGRAAAEARIRMRPADYLPGKIRDPALGGKAKWDTLTDSAGRFRIDSVAPGEYALEALYPEGRGALIRFTIPAGLARRELEGLILQPTGSITGMVRFSDSSRGPASVAVMGTEHAGAADSGTGYFNLAEMPAGSFALEASSPIAFVQPKVVDGIVVTGRNAAQAGSLVLTKGLKQAFTVSQGRVIIAGVDGSNPVFYDNDFCTNTLDNEFVWALASRGGIDLRGNVATRIRRDISAIMPEPFSAWTEEARACRLSGMRNIPEPVAGATRKLALPPSGKWRDIRPESNPGINLLIAEARQASAAKPLVVLAGGPLTTVADAILTDPSIIDKMVVFGVYNQGSNDRDTLAAYLVAKQCRFIEWGNYPWGGNAVPPVAEAFPGNLVGLRMRAERDTATVGEFYTDFGPAALLADGRAWKSAQAANVTAAPMTLAVGVPAPYDIINIPREGNDWAVMETALTQVLADSAAYHAWPVPGTVQAQSFRALSGARLDSIAGEGGIVKELGKGDSLEYSVDAAAAGDYTLTLRYACDSSAQVAIGGPGGERVGVALPADTAWKEIRAGLRLQKGAQSIRIGTDQGSWKLGLLRLDLP